MIIENAYKGIIASMPLAACLISEQGELVNANSAAIRVFSQDSMLPSSLYDCVEGSDQERLRRLLKSWSGSRSPMPGILKLKGSDGGKLHVHAGLCIPRCKDAPAMLLLTVKDTSVTSGFNALNGKISELEKQIVERKKTEMDLLNSQKSLEQAQAISSVGSWEWDVKKNFVELSEVGYRLIDKKPENNLATLESFINLIHPDDRSLLTRAINNCVDSKDSLYEMEFRIVHADSSVHYIHSRGEVVLDRDSQKVLKIIGTLHDITARKKAEADIRELNLNLEKRVEKRTNELKTSNTDLKSSLAELKKTQAQLVESEKMASLGGLVAGVAHEINTPVGVSVSAASFLEMQIQEYSRQYEKGEMTREAFEELINTVKESSNIILTNLKRAANLIRSFKKVAVDQSSDEMRVINLKSYLSEVILSLEPVLKKKRPKVEINCDGNFELYSFPGAISQIISNLVMNSLIHGFNEMKAEEGHIVINIDLKGDAVNILYRDNGIGIPDKNVKKIFEPFFTTKRSGDGSGLGMHIVYNLVNQTLGGKISYLDQTDHGACFKLKFPLQTNFECMARSA